MPLAIVDFTQLTEPQYTGAARILREALAHHPSGYRGPGEAETEVEERRNGVDGWRGFAALAEGELAGWIGAIPAYSHGWELHPLVVDPRMQLRGIGSALLAHFEEYARAEGVLTLYLGTDDDYGGTNLYGRDLFPNVLEAAVCVMPSERGHALSFYQRHGYRAVGVLPDVNGAGKPDIIMAKRLAQPASP